MQSRVMDTGIRQVLISGLAAGVVILTSALLMVPFFGSAMDAALVARNVQPMGMSDAVIIAAMSIVLGVLLMFIYLLASTRFGRGAKAAFIASILVWLLSYVFGNVSMAAYGFLPMGMTILGTLWGLVELVLAGLIGARLYGALEK